MPIHLYMCIVKEYEFYSLLQHMISSFGTYKISLMPKTTKQLNNQCNYVVDKSVSTSTIECTSVH